MSGEWEGQNAAKVTLLYNFFNSTFHGTSKSKISKWPKPLLTLGQYLMFLFLVKDKVLILFFMLPKGIFCNF